MSRSPRGGEYLTVECHISTLEKRRAHVNSRRSLWRYSHTINSGAYPNGTTVHMNNYQYRELRKLQKENGDRVLTIHYLPHTRMMVEYE